MSVSPTRLTFSTAALLFVGLFCCCIIACSGSFVFSFSWSFEVYAASASANPEVFFPCIPQISCVERLVSSCARACMHGHRHRLAHESWFVRCEKSDGSNLCVTLSYLTRVSCLWSPLARFLEICCFSPKFCVHVLPARYGYVVFK
ncbi:unnamed protein product [Scytosiphon promiscuus]